MAATAHQLLADMTRRLTALENAPQLQRSSVMVDGVDMSLVAAVRAAHNAEMMAAEAILAISSAAAKADGRVVVYYIEEPETPDYGDFWIDGLRNVQMWDETFWSPVSQTVADALLATVGTESTLDGKVSTFFEPEQPIADGYGDIWFDTNDGNRLYRWDGLAWVNAQDVAISTAQARADAAVGLATTGLTSASGKNTNYYLPFTTPPSPPAYPGYFKTNDLWFLTDQDNKMLRWNGAAWSSLVLGDLAVGNLDAGSITTGILTGIVVQGVTIRTAAAPLARWEMSTAGNANSLLGYSAQPGEDLPARITIGAGGLEISSPDRGTVSPAKINMISNDSISTVIIDADQGFLGPALSWNPTGYVTFTSGVQSPPMNVKSFTGGALTSNTTTGALPVTGGASGTFTTSPSGLVLVHQSINLRIAAQGIEAYGGFQIRSGGVIGSGTLWIDGTTLCSNSLTAWVKCSGTMLCTLTPNTLYNIRAMVKSMTATIAADAAVNTIIVQPSM